MIPAHIVIGNIISFIAAIIMVASGYIKSKEKTILWQAVQICFNTLACFILGAYSGAVTNLISVPRNVLAYRNKLGWWWKSAFIVITALLTLLFNQSGWIGWIPILSAVPYTYLMDRLKPVPFKALIVYTCVIWCIYDILVLNYVSAAFDISTMITSCIAIYRIRSSESGVSSNEK